MLTITDLVRQLEFAAMKHHELQFLRPSEQSTEKERAAAAAWNVGCRMELLGAIAQERSAATAPLLERIADLTTENSRLEDLVYSPGLWRCAKCKFTLVQRNLNAHSGTITSRDQPGDKCPNCDVNLWRVTERENALENYETAENLHVRLNELEAQLASKGDSK